jgi:hypothetical protein
MLFACLAAPTTSVHGKLLFVILPAARAAENIQATFHEYRAGQRWHTDEVQKEVKICAAKHLHAAGRVAGQCIPDAVQLPSVEAQRNLSNMRWCQEVAEAKTHFLSHIAPAFKMWHNSTLGMSQGNSGTDVWKFGLSVR